MRMPELKSLARDRGLRNYSRMRKTESVAFLTIWVGIILRCAGQKTSDKNLCDISIFWYMGSTPGPFRWGIE